MGKRNLKKKPESRQAALLRKKMRELRESFLRISGKTFKIRPLDDQDGTRVDRSMDVTVEFFDFIMERYGSRYPRDLKGVGPMEDWAMLNVMPAVSLDELASHAMLLEGATLFVLDAIEDAGRLDDLRSMEDDFDWDGNWQAFTFKDSVHTQMDLTYVFNVLRQRNEDCAGFDPKDREEGTVRWLRDTVTLYNRQFQDVPSRNRFESLMSLLPQEVIDGALESLEDRLLAMYDIFMEDRIKDYKKLEQMEWTRQYHKHRLAQERRRYFVQALDFIEDEELVEILRELGEKSDFSDPRDDDGHRRSDVMKDIFAKAAQFGPMFTYSDEALADLTSEEIRCKIREYDIGNLFGHCFSILYMCDRNLSFAWMQYPLSMFVHAVSWQLPWNYIPEVGESEGGMKLEADFFKPTHVVKAHGDRLYSSAQILYTLGEVIAPRDQGEYGYYSLFIDRFPVSKEVKKWVYLAGATLFRSHCLIKQVEDDLYDEEDDAEEKEKIQALCQENERLGKLLKECQEQLREMQYAQKRMERKHADELAGMRYEHDELARLRELLYASRGNVSQEDVDSDLRLPLRLNHKIVCFGGHDSWFRAIRPMLDGDVRFIDTNKSTNTNLVKSSDIVYLQTNALNHSIYHKILSVASKYQKPVFYMPSASAKKCAEHMYQADKSID